MTPLPSFSRSDLRYLEEEESWCIDVVCDGDDVEVTVAGTPKAPDPACMACAQRVVANLSALRARAREAVIQRAAQDTLPSDSDSDTDNTEDTTPSRAPADWELIAVQCQDEEAPDTFSLIWNEPVHDLYGWWEVLFDGEEVVVVRREEW